MNNPNMYLPLDFSDLRTAIPENEEIIYSGYCKCEKAVPLTNQIMYWYSHFLVTPKGFAFFLTHRDNTSEKVYVPLDEIVVTPIVGSLRIPKYCRIQISIHPNFKDPIGLNSRGSKFIPFMADLVIKYLTEKKESIKDLNDKNNQKKVKKLNKSIAKMEKLKKKRLIYNW